MSRVPSDAIHAAAVAMAQVETGPDGTEPNDIDFLLARIALEAAAPHMQAQAISDAAGVLDDLPIENMECYALYEEWKDALNVNHGIQASVRWLNGRAALIRGAA